MSSQSETVMFTLFIVSKVQAGSTSKKTVSLTNVIDAAPYL